MAKTLTTLCGCPIIKDEVGAVTVTASARGNEFIIVAERDELVEYGWTYTLRLRRDPRPLVIHGTYLTPLDAVRAALELIK